MSDEPRRLEDLDRDALIRYAEGLHGSLRQIAHDMSNPLGILRMALYFLQTMNPDEAKRQEYYGTLGQSIDRIEKDIQRLRACSEFPVQLPKAEGETP